MTEMTATQLARHLSEVLDRVAHGGEEVLIVRNDREVAKLVPGPSRMTALEAMGDLFQTISSEAAKDWLKDARSSDKKFKKSKLDSLRNPWDV